MPLQQTKPLKLKKAKPKEKEEVFIKISKTAMQHREILEVMEKYGMNPRKFNWK